MGKKDLIEIIDGLFKPIQFKRKGNYWKHETNELIKILKIQKSIYSNFYYIYFGLNVKGVKDDTFDIQIILGLGSEDNLENKHMHDLFDLDSNIDDGIRRNEIAEVVNEKIINIFNKINTEKDLKNAIIDNTINKMLIPNIILEYFMVK
jgi:hypothetical protein